MERLLVGVGKQSVLVDGYVGRWLCVEGGVEKAGCVACFGALGCIERTLHPQLARICSYCTLKG